MDERKVQQEASEVLLDVGVSVPLKPIKIPFCKKPLMLRMAMRRPRLSTQIKIARLYLSLGTTYKELETLEFVLLLGTESFTNIIRSAEMTNPMKLRLSQRRKGS